MTDKITICDSIEQWPITDRAAWLALRQRDVTASTVGALLGVHEYMTPFSLWLLKTGRIKNDPDETPSMRRGRLLEPVAISLLRELNPSWKITEPKTYYRDPHTRLGASPDAFARDPSRDGHGVLQIKTIEPGIFRHKWHSTDGDLSPPLWIAAQAITEAYLTGAVWAAVVAMRVGHGLDIDVLDIPIHMDLVARIKNETAAFWRSVDEDQPPDPDITRDRVLIERLYNPTGEIIDLSRDNHVSDLVIERENLGASKIAIDRRMKEIKAELLVKLDGASAAQLNDGRMLTAKRVEKAAYQVSASSYIDIRIKGVKS